jgi:hypothetical protein
MTTTKPNTRPSDIVKIIDWCESFTSLGDDEMLGPIKDELPIIAKQNWYTQFSHLIAYCAAIQLSGNTSAKLFGDSKELNLALLYGGLYAFINQQLDFIGVEDHGAIDPTVFELAFVSLITFLCPTADTDKAWKWVEATSSTLYTDTEN